ncbi:MAG: tetratricopeptide repeat protein [Spirosomataceae bacterium]
MKEEELAEKIGSISKKAKSLTLHGKFKESIAEYQQAIALLGEKVKSSKYAVMLFCGIGEAYFLQKKWSEALDYYGKAVSSEGGLGEPLIHLRLGQIRFEFGQFEKAADELMRAYMGGGPLIFKGEEPKYFKLIEPLL